MSKQIGQIEKKRKVFNLTKQKKKFRNKKALYLHVKAMILRNGKTVLVKLLIKMVINTKENIIMGKLPREPQCIPAEQNIPGSLKMIGLTVKELLYFLMDQNIMENLRMVMRMDKELNHGKMEKNI